MSAVDEINGDIYRKMIDLQEKLKQSEAERSRLEEMFKILLKTCKEEEDMRQKYLEARYRSFLDDCARRNYRNEKILRSVERVENAANVLYAKTERLKLLRNHYEAYLGRVIPTWRQNPSLQYGQNRLSFMQKLAWHRQNQLTPEEIPEPIPQQCASHLTVPSTVKSKTSYSDQTVPADYLPRKHVERERFNSQFSNYMNYFNRDNRDPENWEKLIHTHERDKNSPENFDPQINNYNGNKLIKPLINIEEANYGETPMMRGLETQLHHKLVLDNPWESVRNLLPHERKNERVEDNSRKNLGYYPEKTEPPLNESYKFSNQNWAPPGEKHQDGTGECFSNGRPVITREPVEIRKPEFIVGKLHPESRMIFEASELEMASSQNLKQENSIQRPVVPVSGGSKESEGINITITSSSPQNKWNILKHKNSINKLKETLLIAEGYDHQAEEDKKLLDNVIRSVDKLYDSSIEKELTKANENDMPEVLQENWPVGVHKGIPLTVDTDSDKKINVVEENEEIFSGGEISNSQHERQYQEMGGEYSQKEATCISQEGNEEGEGYDDNEETYPESYFEQPPKPDYSRDIVSNVILEEDESEAYANDGVPEDMQKLENEQMKFDSHEVVNNNAEYNINMAEETERSESQYQNIGPDNVTHGEVDPYANSTNYSDIPQQEYMYQEYNQNNNYNNMEQYQGSHPEPQEYYGQPQELENYGGEALEQQQYEHENMYSQQQGFENNPGLEQFGQNYQEQYNEGEMISNENYYNQGEYDGGYYESQLQQSNDYPQNTEGENPDMLQGERLETNQGEDGQYCDENKNSNPRQSYFAQLLESDTESFQMEHGSAVTNEDSDFDFSLSQKQ